MDSLPNEKKKHGLSVFAWIIGLLIALALVAVLTAPDQAAHIKALEITLGSESPELTHNGLPIIYRIVYRNHGVYSTTESMYANPAIIYSYGYFGRVQTTSYILLLSGTGTY
jgi:hypothetical protein